MRKFIILFLSLSFLLSCSNTSIENQPITSSSSLQSSSSSGLVSTPYDPFEYSPYELERIELVISTFERIDFKSTDIIDLKVESFEILENEFIQDFNMADLENEDDVKIEEIKKNLREGTSLYLVAFTIRSVRYGPQTAMAAFATDVALGLVVDFVIEVLPRLFDSENKESSFKLVDAFLFLSRGYKLGSYFDLSFSLAGLAFTSTFGRVIRKSGLTKTIAKNIDSSAKVVNEAVTVIANQSEIIFRNLDNINGKDIKILNEFLSNNVDNIVASQEVKRVIKDAIKNNPQELLGLLSGLNKNVLDQFQKYLDTDNYRKLISGIRTTVLPEDHILRNSTGKQIKSFILERKADNIKYFNDNGISHEKVLEYLRNSYPDKLSMPGSVSRTFNFYLEDLKNIPLGNTSYRNAINNEAIIRGLSIENVERLKSISLYDSTINQSQTNLIDKYFNAVSARRTYGLTGSSVAQIADGIEKLVKSGDTSILELIPQHIQKKELLDKVSSRLNYSSYKKINESIMVDYLSKKIKVPDNLAKEISKAKDKAKLESIIQSIDDSTAAGLILKENLMSAFGLKPMSKGEFIFKIKSISNETISKVYSENYPDIVATKNALNKLLSEGSSNKTTLENAIYNIEEYYKYTNPKIDGAILSLLAQPKLIRQYSNLAFQLDHIRAIKLLNSKFNPADVARFETLVKSNSDGLIIGKFNEEKIQRIAIQYMREVQTKSLDSLSVKNLNIIIFSKYSKQTDPSLILRDSEKLYEIFSAPRTVEEIDSIISSFDINLRNSLTDIYQNSILRQSELILELNNKKLISLNQDFVVKVVKDDLLRLSKQASDEQIKIAANIMIENEVVEKLVAGQFSSLSDEIAEAVLYKYDSILALVKTLPDATQNTFFDSIAKIRGQKSVNRLLQEKQKFISKLSNETLSASSRTEIENSIELIDQHLIRDFLPARDNESFLKFISNYGLTYDEGIERFYTLVEFELNGRIVRKHFAKLDSFADLAVTSVELTGDNSVDFLLVRKMINMADDPLTLTQHHLEDGLNILFVSTDVHKALYHEGGASLLRLLEELKRVEELL